MDNLVDTIDEVIKNIEVLARYSRGNSKEKNFYNVQLKKAKVIIVYKKDNELLFGPSKFVGYTNNNLTHKHEKRDGRETTYKIQSLLKKEKKKNKKL